MPRTPPPLLSVTLTALRRAKGWSEEDLAATGGTTHKMISRLESGKETPSRERVVGLAAGMGYEPEDVDAVLLGLQRATSRPPEGPRSPVDPTPAERRRIRQVAGRLALADLAVTEEHCVKLLRASRARRARRRAEDLVRWLLEEPDPRARRDLVESSAQFQDWAVAERLCHESARAAAGSADRALELAALAVRAAELSPGGAVWLSRLAGYVWLFLGNARRVAGDLASSEEAFVRAKELWEAGAAADPGLLAAWRVPDGEASLRRHQGDCDRALELHDEALAVAPQEALGRILLNKAFTLEQMDEPERALTTLQEAAPLIDGRSDPRLPCVLRFNQIICLCRLRRYQEAVPLLGTVNEMAVALGHELDLLRVLWLRGRVAAGLGRAEEAEVALEQVRRGFRARTIAYDFAEATLELAILYRGQGRTGEVKALAGQTLWIFRTQGVHHEAERALRLFCEAAEAERLTVELARRILEFLRQARHNPRLRFEG